MTWSEDSSHSSENFSSSNSITYSSEETGTHSSSDSNRSGGSSNRSGAGSIEKWEQDLTSDVHSHGLWIVAEASTESPECGDRVSPSAAPCDINAVAADRLSSRTSSSSSSYTHSTDSTSNQEAQSEKRVLGGEPGERATSGNKNNHTAVHRDVHGEPETVGATLVVATRTTALPAVVPSPMHSPHYVPPNHTSLMDTPITQTATITPNATAPLPTAVAPQLTVVVAEPELPVVIADKGLGVHQGPPVQHVQTHVPTQGQVAVPTAPPVQTTYSVRQTAEIAPSHVTTPITAEANNAVQPRAYAPVPKFEIVQSDNMAVLSKPHVSPYHIGTYPRALQISPLSGLPGVVKRAVPLQTYRTAGRYSLVSSSLSGRKFSDVSSAWSTKANWLYATRYGPTEVPRHVLASHPAFPQNNISPFTLYFFDATAPNRTLFKNDLNDDANGKSKLRLCQPDVTATVEGELLGEHCSEYSTRSDSVSDLLVGFPNRYGHPQQHHYTNQAGHLAGAVPHHSVLATETGSHMRTQSVVSFKEGQVPPQKRSGVYCCGGEPELVRPSHSQLMASHMATDNSVTTSGTSSSGRFSDNGEDGGYEQMSWASTGSTESSIVRRTHVTKAKKSQGCCGDNKAKKDLQEDHRRVLDDGAFSILSHSATRGVSAHDQQMRVNDAQMLPHGHSQRVAPHPHGDMNHRGAAHGPLESAASPTLAATRVSSGPYDIQATEPNAMNLRQIPVHAASRRPSASKNSHHVSTVASHRRSLVSNEYTEASSTRGCCMDRKKPRALRYGDPAARGRGEARKNQQGRSVNRSQSVGSRAPSTRSGVKVMNSNSEFRQRSRSSGSITARGDSRSPAPQKESRACCGGRTRAVDSEAQQRYRSSGGSITARGDSRSPAPQKESRACCGGRARAVDSEAQQRYRSSGGSITARGDSRSRSPQKESRACCGGQSRALHRNRSSSRSALSAHRTSSGAEQLLRQASVASYGARITEPGCCGGNATKVPKYQIRPSYNQTTQSIRGPGTESSTSSRGSAFSFSAKSGVTANTRSAVTTANSHSSEHSALVTTRGACCGVGGPQRTGVKAKTQRTVYERAEPKVARVASGPPMWSKGESESHSQTHYSVSQASRHNTADIQYSNGGVERSNSYAVQKGQDAGSGLCFNKKQDPTQGQVRKFFFNAQQGRRAQEEDVARVKQYSTSYKNYPEVCYDVIVPTSSSRGTTQTCPNFCH